MRDGDFTRSCDQEHDKVLGALILFCGDRDPAEEDTASVGGAPAACPPPNLWPTVLPWLAGGEEVPLPDLARYGAEEEPSGRPVWAAERDESDPDGSGDTRSCW